MLSNLILLLGLGVVGLYGYRFYEKREKLETKEHVLYIGTLVLLSLAFASNYNKKNRVESILKAIDDIKKERNPSDLLPEMVDPSRESPYGKIALVNYHTNWCPASRKFLPHWNELANQIRLNYPFIEVKDVVCEGNELNKCNAEGINAYPSVVLYKGSEKIPYEGMHNVVAMMTFVKNNLNLVQ